MIYLKLFLEFFHIGLFSYGGGYATLPFLYHIVDKYGWYSASQLADMIAISSITPGPLGVNVATFAGYTTAGILGAFIATASILLPSVIIVVIISKLLEQFKNNKYVKSVIYCIKPAGCGLLAAVGVISIFEIARCFKMHKKIALLVPLYIYAIAFPFLQSNFRLLLCSRPDHPQKHESFESLHLLC